VNICYIGKNANKVREILQDPQNNKASNYLIFDIAYDKSYVLLTGNQLNINKLKAKIDALPSKK